jgi:hypothetical protein
VATPEGRTLLKQGRLTEDLEPSGFGSFAGLSAPAGPKTPTPRKSAAGKQQEKIESLRKRLLKAEGDAQARDAEASDLEEEARAAEGVARKAGKAAETARKKAESAAAEAQRIRAELAGLEKNG